MIKTIAKSIFRRRELPPVHEQRIAEACRGNMVTRVLAVSPGFGSPDFWVDFRVADAGLQWRNLGRMRLVDVQKQLAMLQEVLERLPKHTVVR
jgi:hypothetical protein